MRFPETAKIGKNRNWGLWNMKGAKKIILCSSQGLELPFFLDSQAPASERYKMIYGAGMIDNGDEIWMYFLGSPNKHGRKYKELGPARPGGIGRIRVRKNGFVSQSFSRSGGRLTTVPVRAEGNRLLVNMGAGAGGRLKAELLDRKNNAFPGFKSEECGWLRGNSTKMIVS